MSELRKNPFSRGAQLARLPLGAAGRSAKKMGRRLRGADSDELNAADQQAAAMQLFSVLGELKGGAMKIGQALSVFESALPDEMTEPYRDSLRNLQDSAPPMDFSSVDAQMTASIGENWRDHFEQFSEEPAASASLGQVHRAKLAGGADVAVKVQYPGAEKALLGDIAVMARLGRMAGSAIPGIDMGPLLDELKERAAEELDYELEGVNQQAAASVYSNHPDVVVPQVHAAYKHVLITDWLAGTPLRTIIEEGTTEQRDHACAAYARFLLDAPATCGVLHADPHPGNFRITPDGRFGVLDFGAVKQLPNGMPGAIGRLASLRVAGRNEEVVAGLREEGFIKAAVKIDTDQLMSYLDPFLEPVRTSEFTFSKEWLADLFIHVKDPETPAWSIGLKLNLPPEYLLIHRVWSGAIGILCQLGGTVAVPALLNELLPESDLPE